MLDVQRDNRLVSITNKTGLRNTLLTMLDQLERCQKSLSEFLEVRLFALCLYTVERLWEIVKILINKEYNKLAFKSLPCGNNNLSTR